MILLENIHKSFKTGFIPKNVNVLNGLDLKVANGEVYGFLGSNGAGKTTTIKILMNLIEANSGIAKIDGVDVSDHNIRNEVGFLPEQPYFYDYLTGIEFLDYCGRLFKIPSKARKKKISNLIEMVGLTGSEDRALRFYSRGMLQRIGIAQALINEPKLLVLDEPLSGLDPVGRRDVIEILKEEKKKGTTIFFSSHILADTESFCDKIGIIIDGKISTEEKLEDLLSSDENIRHVEILVKSDQQISVDTFIGLDNIIISIDETNIGSFSIKLNSSQKLNDILSRLIELGCEINDVSKPKLSLEDIYLKNL